MNRTRLAAFRRPASRALPPSPTDRPDHEGERLETSVLRWTTWELRKIVKIYVQSTDAGFITFVFFRSFFVCLVFVFFRLPFPHFRRAWRTGRAREEKKNDYSGGLALF